ncbi:hypothetical protein NP233_g4864 [Leucocoprinus birnbaumii]|uniref:P-loop containing nucleoside triphosphate hydrolase protein n=1 Tax=Leucocoprinus birnbaumii TaxID=56174 RepID=A0AAD5VTW9_9AGAR|nr:hypothetical protein NP233_g4864 [Leucocoprinus birnbaumii]
MRSKKGIVKSGNAGNASKSSTSKALDTTPKPNAESPLFPPGYKYPLSLLHERCQKEAWEKPVIDTSVPEARHWGATYALYRFCNGMQLHRALPPGPRDYWHELAAEHKGAPEHLNWMYAADPFAAWKEVKERQAKAAQKREAAVSSSDNDPSQSSSLRASGVFKDSPEVRMAVSLREVVEMAIKEGFALYGNDSTQALEEETISQVSSQLKSLGFKDSQTKKASSFLSEPSPLLAQFLHSSSPLEAATEYLILSVPECDLPPKFLPSVNSSNPFVSSVYSGSSDIKKRWMEEKAVKEAGFPIHTVQALSANLKANEGWPALLVALGKRLLDVRNVDQSPSGMDPFILDEQELISLGGERHGDGHYTLPSFTGPITLHILYDAQENAYPRPGFCPMYITSDTVPAYVRLHMLSRILSVLGQPADEVVDSTFGTTLMRLLDEEWAQFEDHGPPDVHDVLGHLMPSKQTTQPLATFTPKMDVAKVTATNIRQGPQNRPVYEKKPVSKNITDARKRLPAFKAKVDFLRILLKDRVVVVVGETVPQYILESYEELSQGQSPNIIVTQPRRISAISVSDRVSEERGHDGTVGYAVRGKSKQGKLTQLLFCTTGVVLRRLNNGDRLQNVTHVVVDEVHERSLDGDFLLLALRQLVDTHPQLKIILMSATINHEIFSRYFSDAPVLSIPGITHPIDDKYLEDIIPMIGYLPTSDKQKLNDEKMLKKLRQIYPGLEDRALIALHNITNTKSIDYQVRIQISGLGNDSNRKRAGILIFLPGANEIRHCLDSINVKLKPGTVDTFPLHANLPIEDQSRVFSKTGKWKVIAATNVAETSITIDDIVYVIDTGKVKETHYSPTADLTRLEETLVTRAAARQRRGRAGRMQPGVCYKLYTRHVEEVDMEEFPKPEILRVPLEQVSLSAKVMDEHEDVKSTLSRLIDPPDPATIERAWSNLQELGAIDPSDNLTSLGRHIAMLPLDVRLAKMLVFGTIFHCLSPVLTIVALMSSKPLFTSPESSREEASKAKRRFIIENSDILTELEAFNQCWRLKGQPKALQAFCEENFISRTTLQEIFTLRREFCAALQERGFLAPDCDPMDSALNENSDNSNLLKAIILGGLWPRVARVHLPKSAIKFDKVQAGAVQRDNTAKEFKMFDLKEGRVFVHPGSVLFDCTVWKSPFLAYFHKYQSSKVFLRDATEVPLYALLLFGGPVSVDHVKGGLTVGNRDAFVCLRAWPRIGVLVNQLRQLLDLLLSNCIEDGSSLSEARDHPVILAMLSLLFQDGMTE